MRVTRHRTWVADPAFDPGGLVHSVTGNPGRDRGTGPYILAAVPGGEVRITNGWLPPTAVQLYRFGTLAQAAAGAAVVRPRARLTDDGYAWEIADVADHRPLRDIAGAKAAILAWAKATQPDIEAAMQGLGSGWYSLLPRELRR